MGSHSINGKIIKIIETKPYNINVRVSLNTNIYGNIQGDGIIFLDFGQLGVSDAQYTSFNFILKGKLIDDKLALDIKYVDLD